MSPLEVLETLKLGKEVEYQSLGDIWRPLNTSSDLGLLLAPCVEFRLKPQKMVTINGVSFPKPETVKPVEDIDYYYPCPETVAMFGRHSWLDDTFDNRILRRGLLHLTKENAIAHSQALIKLSGGTYN